MLLPIPSFVQRSIFKPILLVDQLRLSFPLCKPCHRSTALLSTFENEGSNSNNSSFGPSFDWSSAKPEKPLSKADLYENDDLLRLISIHNLFSDEYTLETPFSKPMFEPTTSTPTSLLQSNISFFDEDTKIKVQSIRAIASDVDGTLLSSRQTLHPRTKLAIKHAIDLASRKQSLDYFFLATGKSRRGALNSLGYEVENWININHMPGVYLQGLYCVDGNGNVVFEKKLSSQAIAAAEVLVSTHGISIVAYNGDALFTTKATEIVRHLHDHYGEPMPLELSTLEKSCTKLIDYKSGFHKILLMDDNIVRLREVIRPQLEDLAKQHNACVTQAIPTMLELLPEGCSKALGVSKVCEALKIDMSRELLAMGDAENDVGMLTNAAIGVAVGNACPKAKEAADFVMTETNDEGGAGAAMELFGFKQT